jgi:hypothetical protein
MKPLIELSVADYDSLLKYDSEMSSLYPKLKNAVKTEASTIAILCDLQEAEILCAVAKLCCPDTIPCTPNIVSLFAKLAAIWIICGLVWLTLYRSKW